MSSHRDIRTLGGLRKTSYRPVPVKEEIRRNLMSMKRDGRPPFEGIVGYAHTVLPKIENALLSRHDFLLLGLRGQAKTRILRQLVRLLDEWTPAIAGCQINDDPLSPLCKRCRRLQDEQGDDLPLVWLHRDERYQEKLATPDVTIADLIGDIDPIKAARDRLTFADEEVIHFGIVPRTHRGIFALNELPDLQPRIQVGLLNIMEERDFQIRGFPVRLLIDVLMVFSANPEDYTNRGNIITPLKDRIASQILTHYPRSLEEAMRITDQEAWTERGIEYHIPKWFREILEQVAFEARGSEFVDQNSGVSARIGISAYESLLSNLERRALETGDGPVYPRIADLQAVVPAISGKIELVYEGEQQGPDAVARHIVGQAVKTVFQKHFPRVTKEVRRRRRADAQVERPAPERSAAYDRVTAWFSGGERVAVSDLMPQSEYVAQLHRVDSLEEIAREFMPAAEERELPGVMELVLEGLYQNSFVAKETVEYSTFYSDMLMRMFDGLGEESD
ncbi:MAG: magnesium chelatase [Candidatus Krumholzibacteriia bacterium]